MQPEMKVSLDYTEWRLNGKLHNLYGPAIVGKNGYKSWYVNGVLHRLDGPATENPLAETKYYIIYNGFYMIDSQAYKKVLMALNHVVINYSKPLRHHAT